MKKYLEFIEGSSSKFWSVETEDNLMTITYGRIGTAGKSDTKTMPSAEAAEKEAIKQANGKIKKGYVEKDAPEGMASPTTVTSQKTEKVKAVKESPKPKRPIDVIDDGKLKEWHDEDYWDACFWDAETYQGLDKPIEKSTGKKDKKGEGETGKAIEKFLDACNYGHPDEYKVYIEKLRAALPQEEFEEILNKGMDKAHRYNYGSLDMENFEIIELLLAEGIKLPEKEKRGDKTLDAIADLYIAANGAKSYQDIINEFFIHLYTDVASSAEKLFRTAIANLKAAEYYDKDGVDGYKLGMERLGFRIDADGDIEIRLSGALHHDQKAPLLEKAEYTKAKINKIDSDIEGKYLAICMRPLVEQMDKEGLFDDLSSIGHIIITTRYNKIFFEKTTDSKAKEETRKRLEKQLEFLETTEDWNATKDVLRSSIMSYLICGFDPDGTRCLNILHRLRYCGISDISVEAYHTIKAGRKVNDKFFVPYTFELAMQEYDDFCWYWYQRYLEEILAKEDYEPARKKLADWAKEEKLLTYKDSDNPEDEEEDDDNDNDDDKQQANYTDADLFLETDTMIARADESGRINIRFKEESLQGYTDVLGYLNNLMEKGYSKTNDGYQMGVYFIAQPEFPKIKFHDYMPRVPEMALFYKALMYEELHEEVRKFVTLTINEFDHYHDLDGEYSTVCGTFAAIAAAMYDIKFMDLAILLALETDGEHEEIAYHFTNDLKKRYGVTPESVAAIYELGASCDHSFKSCKELYTIPENLEAFILYYTENPHRFSKTHLCGFLATIAGSSRGILKKIKEYFDGSGDIKVKTIYAEFYNLALEILEEEDGKNYGEPIYAEGKVESDTSIEIEHFEESMPVIITADEATKRGNTTKEELSSTEGRAVFVFRTSAITNPYIFDFVHQNREAIGKINDICPSYTCHSGNNLEMLDKKWAFDLKGAACQHGMIIYDGKNKPVVLYGVLDYANILRKFGKKSTTDRALLEQLRVDNLKLEAPKGSPVPESIAYNDEYNDYLGMADENIYRSSEISAQVNLKKITKDHPHYPASLLLWVELMKKRKDVQALKRIYTELLELLPEHAEYWNKALKKIH